jgi:hypothetical protein
MPVVKTGTIRRGNAVGVGVAATAVLVVRIGFEVG